MSLSVCSFGRDFLSPSSGSRPRSLRFCVRALLAARRRWPHGRLRLSVWSGAVAWVVPEGVCPPGSRLCGLSVCLDTCPGLRLPLWLAPWLGGR